MSKTLTGLALAVLTVGLTAGPVRAEATKVPGSLTVYDEARLFSQDGIDRAKATLRGTTFDRGLKVTVDTYPEPPEDKTAAAEAAKGDRQKWHDFLENWAKEVAKGDKAEGIYVLISQRPGGVAVLTDRQTRERGFTDADADKVRNLFIAAGRETNKVEGEQQKQEVWSKALQEATEFVVTDLKDTTAATPTGTKGKKSGGSMGIGGWVCLGLAGLLGAWLVIGLIRAFSGGGGGGPGGGGGFLTSLFGGLFGAMAGMWLYNSFFGGGGMFGGSDATASEGGADTGDTGAGDWDGGGGSAGGWDGGSGDFGGGDFGGDF